MPWYGFIHPVFAIVTMVYGIGTARTSMSKADAWDFPLRRVRTRTVIYFLLCVANLVLGYLMNAVLHGRGAAVKLTAHVPLAIAAVGLALVAAIFTFTRSRVPGQVSPLMKFQGWVLAVSMSAILTMAFVGLLALLGM
jgi:hypothetical protein